MELRIGIDASINATGFVFIVKDGSEIKEVEYRKIIPKTESKAALKITPSAKLEMYDRIYESKTSTYSQCDIYKIISAEHLAQLMIELIKDKLAQYNYEFEKVSCRIEGSLMSSSFKGMQARVNDLVAFGAVMRIALLKTGLIDEIQIIPPKTLKKLATGNGNAKKDDMIKKHMEVYAHHNFQYSGKVDDMIDAFWLAEVHSPLNKIEKIEYKDYIEFDILEENIESI